MTLGWVVNLHVCLINAGISSNSMSVMTHDILKHSHTQPVMIFCTCGSEGQIVVQINKVVSISGSMKTFPVLVNINMFSKYIIIIIIILLLLLLLLHYFKVNVNTHIYLYLKNQKGSNTIF